LRLFTKKLDRIILEDFRASWSDSDSALLNIFKAAGSDSKVLVVGGSKSVQVTPYKTNEILSKVVAKSKSGTKRFNVDMSKVDPEIDLIQRLKNEYAIQMPKMR